MQSQRSYKWSLADHRTTTADVPGPLEERGPIRVGCVHLLPDIDDGRAKVGAGLRQDLCVVASEICVQVATVGVYSIVVGDRGGLITRHQERRVRDQLLDVGDRIRDRVAGGGVVRSVHVEVHIGHRVRGRGGRPLDGDRSVFGGRVVDSEWKRGDGLRRVVYREH